MFFLNNSSVHIKVSVMLIHLEFVGIFFKRTAKSAITVTICEHVMNVLTHEFVAFKMRIKFFFKSIFQLFRSSLKVPDLSSCRYSSV